MSLKRLCTPRVEEVFHWDALLLRLTYIVNVFENKNYYETTNGLENQYLPNFHMGNRRTFQ